MYVLWQKICLLQRCSLFKPLCGYLNHMPVCVAWPLICVPGFFQLAGFLEIRDSNITELHIVNSCYVNYMKMPSVNAKWKSNSMDNWKQRQNMDSTTCHISHPTLSLPGFSSTLLFLAISCLERHSVVFCIFYVSLCSSDGEFVCVEGPRDIQRYDGQYLSTAIPFNIISSS